MGRPDGDKRPVGYRGVVFLALAFCLAWLAPAGMGQSAAPPQVSIGPAADTVDVFPPPPPEDTTGVPARLSVVEGAVQLLDHAGKLFDQAQENMEFDPGMRIETGDGGRAEIQFPDGSVARVTPNSALSFVAVNPGAQAAAQVTLGPARGLTYYEFAQAGSQLTVQVGKLFLVAAKGPNQSALLRVSQDNVPYEAAVLRGAVHVQDANGDSPFDLPANQSAKIDPASATNYDVVQEVAPDSWDAWNTDRDKALAELTGAGTRSNSGEPNTAGWNDLDYYGSWYDVPGQGLAWAPDGVDQNFDPYGSGAWGYYTNAGYSWASSYPWGWLPYHCGYWNYYDGSGWMWMPNGCGWGLGNVWYPYGGLHNLPRGYRPPPRPVVPRGVAGPHAGQNLIAVNRGQSARFRDLGQPRPPARTLSFAGDQVPPLAVAPREGYGTAPLGLYGGGAGVPVYRPYAGAGGSREAVPGYGRPYSSTVTTAPRAITPAPPRAIYTLPPPPAVRAMPPPAAASGHPH